MSALRDLRQLLGDQAGRDLLASHDMYTDVGDFRAALRPPGDPALSEHLGLAPDVPLVHVGQQVCADYHAPVAAKFEAADALREHGIAPVLIWHDADRAGSEYFGMRVVLPSGRQSRGIWLAHRSLAEREMRFVPVESARIEQLFEALGAWVHSHGSIDRAAAGNRVRALADAVRASPRAMLGAVNGALSEHLLRQGLGLELSSEFISSMLDRGLLSASLNSYLAACDDVVRLFNEAVAEQIAAGIDPRLKPLSDDYLPLFYSCESCGVRTRMVHVRSGNDHYASAVCRCGADRRFHLGSRTMSLGDVEATGRWSPDVSLPVHHNQLASGWVVGRSTALYGMVFNKVLERCFGLRPIPALVPASLGEVGVDGDADDAPSLLLGYLAG